MATPETASATQYLVEGNVSWADGRPVTGIVIRAVDQDLRTEQPLGPYAPGFREETRTDGTGHYVIPYTYQQFARAEDDTADLIVRALGADGTVVAASPVLFNAPLTAVINLQIAGAVPGQPSEYDRVVARVIPLLDDVDPPSLLSLQPADQPFLAGETGFSQQLISALLSAVTLTRGAIAVTVSAVAEPSIPIAAFYGLIREGVEPAWSALLLLGTPPLAARMTAAASGGIIPSAIGAQAQRLAAAISAAAARQALASPTAGQQNAVSQLLGPASLSQGQQETVLTAASSATGSPAQFWDSLSGQPGFDQQTVARLQLTLQLGLLTGNHTPLVQQLLTGPALTSPAGLVSMDSAAWATLITTEVNGQPIGVPPGVPGATTAEQTANYVSGIMGTLQAAFPNQTVANLVTTNTTIISDEQLRAAVTQFFASSPDFDISTTRISSYLQGQPALAGQLQRLQRAFQISAGAGSMESLLVAGLDAAHKVANIPRQLFASRYGDALGGEDTALSVHDRATFINGRSVELMTQMNDLVNGAYPISITGGKFGNGSSAAQQTLTDAYPDFTELFGALDPCNCDDCTSAISPTAYFVDLLQFLANSTPNSAGNTPLDVLIGNTTLTAPTSRT
jgi:hypothetical protein